MCAAPVGGDTGGTDGAASDAVLKLGRLLTRVETSPDFRAVYRQVGRDGDGFYRDRWNHDKVVPSGHGVDCTGSCRWKVYFASRSVVLLILRPVIQQPRDRFATPSGPW